MFQLCSCSGHEATQLKYRIHVRACYSILSWDIRLGNCKLQNCTDWLHQLPSQRIGLSCKNRSSGYGSNGWAKLADVPAEIDMPCPVFGVLGVPGALLSLVVHALHLLICAHVGLLNREFSSRPSRMMLV